MRGKKAGVLFLLLMVILLCACQEKNKHTFGPERDTVYVSGGIEIDAKDNVNETKTGTKMTDAIEKLLYEKYGEEFVCEQELYYEEFSLLCNFTAYPKSNPAIRFALDVTGEDELVLWHDDYYNVLCKDEINDFVYPAVEPYQIARDHFFIDHLYMITSKDISKETFRENQFCVYISVSEQDLDRVKSQMKQIITDIYDQVQSGSDFYVYLCDDSVKDPESFSYDKVWQTYDVDWNWSKDTLQVMHEGEAWDIATASPTPQEQEP